MSCGGRIVPEFSEISGLLTPGGGSEVGGHGRVVLSNFASGASPSQAQPTCGIKYVATGTEIYRYGGKTYAVGAGNFLIVPEGTGGDVEIGKSETASTLGLCLYLPWGQRSDAPTLEAPMMFPASCSRLGSTLRRAVAEMMRPRTNRTELATSLIDGVTRDLEPLIEETVRMIDGIDALKPSTRYDAMRRLNIARGYLHEVTDRPVELAELAPVAGISRFQLLRNFRDVFGAPPAAYHRNIRLLLAKQEVDSRRLTCSEAAHRFGFADCSSFSHAYRRRFGEAPIRSLAA
jgi:AraC-like DNA-binding protein